MLDTYIHTYSLTALLPVGCAVSGLLRDRLAGFCAVIPAEDCSAATVCHSSNKQVCALWLFAGILVCILVSGYSVFQSFWQQLRDLVCQV